MAGQGTGRRLRAVRRYPPHTDAGATMSKKTKKRRLKAKRNKANHGKRPNVGRR
jgi:hypothetical protein